MGMCKECKEVFSALEMRNGLCKGCMTEEELQALEKGIPQVKEEKKKSERIISWRFLGIFIVLLLISTIISYFLIEDYPDAEELFTALFGYSIAGLIYTGLMALIGLIKKIDTENKIWLITSTIIIIFILIFSYEDNENIALIIFYLSPFIILPKLAFILKSYLDKRAVKKSEYLKNNPPKKGISEVEEEKKRSKIDEFMINERFNRKMFFLGIILPVISIGSILLYAVDMSEATAVLFYFILLFLLLFGLIRRGRDIGFSALRTLVLEFSLVPFFIFLSNFEIFYHYLELLILLLPLILAFVFLLVPSSKKEKIITSKFEKIGLSLLLIGLIIFDFVVIYQVII